jgi:tetratricopeptide (TPR) repeat protein
VVWFRVLLAASLVLFAGTVTHARAADWQVHRTDGRALLDTAERAFRERPDDFALAERLVRIAGRDGAAGKASLRARFRVQAERARAAGGPSAYPALAGYAWLLLALGDAPAAVDAFGAALAVAPESAAAHEGQARALARTGQADAALAAYDGALERERRPAARRRMLEAALAIVSNAGAPSDDSTAADARRARQQKAIALRRALLELDPESEAAAESLADALEDAGRRADAAQVLEQALARAPRTSRVRLTLRAARLRFEDGEPADATRASDQLLTMVRSLPLSDGDERSDVWRAAIAGARRQGALASLARALEDDAKRVDAAAPRAAATEWDLLAQVRDELGDLEAALAAARAASARAPRDLDIGRRLLALLDRLGRDREASAAARDLARENPNDWRLALELMTRQVRREQRPEAEASFDRALVRFARNPDALAELAALAGRWGDNERALAAWQRLRHIDPRNEVALIGLGEAQFQAGKRDEARRTWSMLRERAHTPAAGHLRLAEVLLEHDLATDAAAEARRAQVLDPKSVAPHRLLAQILERQRKTDEALAEWNLVLALSAPGPGGGGSATAASSGTAPGEAEHASLRREARVRMLALLGRLGRARLDALVRKLRDEVRARPDDAETIIFLAEAEQRNGDVAGAIGTLRGYLDGRAADPAGRGRDTWLEASFALVHLLKRTGQLDEAAARLDGIARLAPGRARDAQLQLAELALARYDRGAALSHAAAAARTAPGTAAPDGATLARVADIQARAGADDLAIATYREAIAHDAGPAAPLALARLLIRRGDNQDAAGVLEQLLRDSQDEEAIADASRLAVDVDELAGRLPQLAEALVEGVSSGTASTARRRALVAVLARVLPALYRDPAADARRLDLGRHALRPMLELVLDPEQAPDRITIELLGMLGDGDAAPALIRVAAGPTTAGRSAITERSGGSSLPPTSAETQLAALIALARLGDVRGRPALERHVASVDPQVRGVALWGLGRIADPRDTALLLKSLDDRHPSVVAAVCLGLAHQADARAATEPRPLERTAGALLKVAADPARPLAVRRSAIFALARVHARTTTAALLDLFAAGDADLATSAGLALGWTRDPAALPVVLARAVVPRRFGFDEQAATLGALRAWAAGAPVPDEARYFDASRGLEWQALALAVEHADLAAVWRPQTRGLTETLARSLDGGGDARHDALAALDSRADGPGLGALTTAMPEPVAAETELAILETAQPLAQRLHGLLRDPDAATHAAALRVLTKLGDERVNAAEIAAALDEPAGAGVDSTTSPGAAMLAQAAAFAAARLLRDHPAGAAALASALAPALSDPSWRRRAAAVDVLAALGASGRPLLERALADRHPLVRGAAGAALAQPSAAALDLPSAQPRMP